MSNSLPNHNKQTSPADISFDLNLLVFLLDSKFQTILAGMNLYF